MNSALIRTSTALLLAVLVFTSGASVRAQKKISEARRGERRAVVRAITIPVTLRLREPRQQSEIQSIDYLTLLENGDEQEILSLRGGVRSPLSLAILIQDDLVSSVSNEINGLADFIRSLPPGTRVLVGYLRAGSIQVRQRFTNDLERAAKSLRIPVGSSSVAPYNPYSPTIDALKRFESQPIGRRALMLISDGLDISRGFSSSTPAQSIDLQRALNEALRRSVAVYSIYAPSAGGTGNGNSLLVGNGQGSLQKLSTETGGRAFFQGTGAPVSFTPFLREINTLLSRQFALTYLSTHAGKGPHRIQIMSSVSEGEILYPTEHVR